MARARDPNRDKAFEIYKEHNGDITNRKIAEMLDVPERTIGSWKSRAKDNWIEKLNGVRQSNERSTPKTAKKKTTSNTPKKRSGNPNPTPKFAKRNTAAMIHGLRSKFLHEDQIEIMEAFDGFDIADKLWLQLEVKFSAIIRMQKIMWVEDGKDHLREVSMRSSGDNGDMVGYKVAFAYERFEAYVKAQARAMSEYRSLANEFLKHAGGDDERRLKLEKMQLDIDKTNIEIDKLEKDDDKEGPIQIQIVSAKKKE